MADDVAEFNDAVEAAWAHHRIALGYLRTGNVDLAVLEVERMAAAWGVVIERFGGKRPAIITDQALYVTTLTDIALRAVTVHIMIDAGRPELARNTLAEMRNTLARLRRASGIVVLADCVLDANGAMDALFVFKDAPPDFSTPEARAKVLAQAERYADQLKLCGTVAPDRVRGDPDFRRLTDGALVSLAQVPRAVETGDRDLLLRLLIELRSFDNLLAFRFG